MSNYFSVADIPVDGYVIPKGSRVFGNLNKVNLLTLANIFDNFSNFINKMYCFRSCTILRCFQIQRDSTLIGKPSQTISSYFKICITIETLQNHVQNLSITSNSILLQRLFLIFLNHIQYYHFLTISYHYLIISNHLVPFSNPLQPSCTIF